MCHNVPEQIPVPDVSELAAMEQGRTVGRLARNLFPEGIKIANEPNGPEDFCTQTENCLDRRVPIFEAAFFSKGLFARADIMNPVGDEEWDLYEVKAAADVKEEHIWDVAFQAQIVAAVGLKLRRCHVIHIDTEYVRKEAINISELFQVKDVTTSVLHIRAEVTEAAEKIFKIIHQETCPQIPIGPRCDDPISCPLKKECWSSIKNDSVTTLY